jgi:hypothetical protein
MVNMSVKPVTTFVYNSPVCFIFAITRINLNICQHANPIYICSAQQADTQSSTDSTKAVQHEGSWRYGHYNEISCSLSLNKNLFNGPKKKKHCQNGKYCCGFVNMEFIFLQ